MFACFLALGFFLSSQTFAAAPAGFPISENFTSGIPAGTWTAGGTAPASAYTDATVGGYSYSPDAAGKVLKLTLANSTEAGFAFYTTAFSSAYGLNATFDYYSGGGSGADGFSFFLINGAYSPTSAGASGGPLGYGYGVTPGLDGGWVGIGFDEYGNFAVQGGDEYSTQSADYVTIRGQMGATTTSGYNYKTKGYPGFSIDHNTAWRKANVTVDKNQHITVKISNDGGSTYATPVDDYNLSQTAPATFKFGFAGSTGGATNKHYIDNLNASVPVDNAVAISGFPSSPIPGSSVSFTLQVYPLGSTTVNVDDGASVTLTTSGLNNVSFSSGTYNLSGGTSTITVTGSVTASGGSAVAATATVSASTGFGDMLPSNSSASGSTVAFDLPALTIGSATSVTTSSAILNGTVSTNGTTTTALFQYGTASGSYTGTSTQTTVTGSTTSAVSSTISSLSAGATYYYRLAAHHSSGTSTSSQVSFITSYDVPAATTSSATSVTTSSAILNGTVGTNGTTTTALFQYGTASGSYTGTSTQTTITGSSTSAVSSTISSLSSATLYYYRISANNSSGTSTGSQESFTTSTPSSDPPPTRVTLTVTSTSPSSGATGVAVNTTISATFNDNINGSTATTDSFKVSGGGSDIQGSVSTNGKTITFTPSGNLAYNTTYTATITTRVQAANAAGTTLDSSYSWSFTTESAAAVSTPTPAVTTSPSPTPAAASSPTPVPSAAPIQTPTPTPTTSGVSGELYLNKAVAYLSGDTVAVTVVDADRDANAASEDTLTTALKVTALGYYAGGDLMLDMKENGANSGTFLATIKTGTTTTGGASSGTRSNIGVMKTVQGGTATVVYTDTAPNVSTIAKTLSFSSADATLAFDAESYTVGSYAVVTHVDAEENSDHTQEEPLLNHAVIETSSINRAWMKLVETGIDTGTFKGSILVSSEATLDYERIQASGGDTLTAGCPDEINTSGAPRQVTAVSRVISAEATPTPATIPSPTPVITATPTPEVCIAERITLSSYKLKVIKNQSAEVTVSVLGKGDCPVEGAKVLVLYLVTNPNDSGLISVSRRSAVTNADGQAVFTIKARNKTGKADLTFKTNGLKGARLVVKVSR